MRYRVLGPLELCNTDKGWSAIGAAKSRIVLATMLAKANTPVPNDLIAEHLWNGSSPKSAIKLIHFYVHRIRQTIGDQAGTMLRTRPQGYELIVHPGERDVDRFLDAINNGRRELQIGHLSRAADCFWQAMLLWRGAPYPDLVDTDVGRSEASALEEKFLLLKEQTYDIELCIGRHAQLIPELRGLVLTHPLRERFHEQLMLAQYAAGRRADAAKTFDGLRDLLDRELGIGPGPLAREILATMLADRPATTVLATVRSSLGAPAPGTARAAGG